MSVTDPLLIEKLEVLAGSRKPGQKNKAAVRIEDLSPILNYSYRLKSKEVSGEPTVDDYKALADDVRNIHETLQSLSLIFKRRLGIA